MSPNNYITEPTEHSIHLKEKSVHRVTLIRPPVVISKWGTNAISGTLCPPVGLAYIAGSLRAHGYSVSIVDPVGEAPFEMHLITGHSLAAHGWDIDKIVAAIPPDTLYIGISCKFSHEWPISKQLAMKIRKQFPDAIIIAGGEHMTAIPEYCLQDSDDINYVVLGEGEETVVELVDTLEQGKDISTVNGLVYLHGKEVIRTEPRQRIQDLDTIPWPAWDLLPIENYLDNGLSYGTGSGRSMPMMSSRGCPYRCEFCSSRNMWSQRWYARNPKDVVDEMETYIGRYGASNFDFYDLTASINKQWIREFPQELINRNLNITWQMPAGTRAEAIDDEVASLLARSGHRNIVYAPESGSNRMLKHIKKKASLPHMMVSMRSAIRGGMSVKLNLVIGFPKETFSDIIQTYIFLIKVAWIGVDDATVFTFIPYPGSEFFNYLRKSGRIKSINEEFFYELATIGDVHFTPSFSEQISSRALRNYKFFGMILFYSLSFLFRPQRFFVTMWNVYKGDHKTRIEKALSSMISKVRVYRQA
ncbi:MAG: B12-binding domain-containing radical SAM protein [Planctomycetota bacterium]|jgi:radical SAM superfamily enzyme YgiQ (UPF0313 family)